MTGEGETGEGVHVRGADAVVPTREDPVARWAAPVLGGPAGGHVRTARSPLAAAAAVGTLLGTAVLVLAVLLRQHCRETLWASPDQFTHACYSDIPTQFAAAALDRGVVPYLSTAGGSTTLDLPFGVGWLLWFLGELAPAGQDEPRWVFDLAVLLLAAGLAVTVVAVAHLAGRRPWDALLVALSPVVLVASLIGFELVGTALALGGLWASARGRPVVAGVLVGLAATVSPLLALVLLALVLVAWRRSRDDADDDAADDADDGRGGGAPGQEPADLDDPGAVGARAPVLPVARTVLAAAAVWAVVGLPVLLVSPAAFEAAVLGRIEAGIGYGSLWLVPSLAGYPLVPAAGTVAAVVGTAGVVLAVTLFVLRAPRPPRVPVVVLLLLVGTMVVGSALPPQVSVLVLPFAALAVPRWRDLLLWGVVEAAATTGTWLYLYGVVGGGVEARGLAPWAYAVLLVGRMLALAWLARCAVVTAVDADADAVRRPASQAALGEDDPALPAAQALAVPRAQQVG